MDVSGAFLASVFLKVSWAIGKSFFLFEENLLGGVIHLFRLHYLQLAGLIPAARSRSAALHGPSQALTSSAQTSAAKRRDSKGIHLRSSEFSYSLLLCDFRVNTGTINDLGFNYA